MERLHEMFFMLIVLSLMSFSASTDLYSLEIKTSSWHYAGTTMTVGVQLVGKKDNIMSYSPWKIIPSQTGNGTRRFEVASLDFASIQTDNLGLLTDIQVKLIQSKQRMDWWKVSWIKVEHKGIIYRGFFNGVIKGTEQIKTSYAFQLEDCPNGFYIAVNNKSRICTDRNECLETCNMTNQICINYPGGYHCSCVTGFQLHGDTCEDTNECYGLEDPCINFPNTECKNVDGGYTCSCKEGFQRIGNTCIDVNECLDPTSSHQCEHTCKNVIGSYECKCRPEFILAPDGTNCIEADPCVLDPCNNLTSTCYQMGGRYECLCKDGYEKNYEKQRRSLVISNDECKRRKCYPLFISDKRIQVSPSQCSNPTKNHFGDICKFSCQPGYELHPSSAEKYMCNEDGIWLTANNSQRTFEPRCIAKVCPKLTPLKNGYVVPSACINQGVAHSNNCVFYCDEGYKLVGQTKIHCHEGKFDKYEEPYCIPVPKIECPEDAIIYLPVDRDSVTLGQRYKGVVTNMPEADIYSIPSLVGPEYEFSLGSTIVEMRARNHLGDEVRCHYRVTVKDRSPPVIKFCPRDQFYTAKPNEKIFVQWKEPKFVDNVGIKEIKNFPENKKYFGPISFRVVYNAVDLNENIASCEFTVHVKLLTCSVENMIGGDQAINKLCTAMGPTNAFCTAQCPEGKTFHESPPQGMKNSWWCFNGVWSGIRRIPDCVSFKAKTGSRCSAGSVETYDYRGNPNPVCGRCPRGTRYVQSITKINKGKCVVCPLHTFQDVEGARTCKPCPFGFGTKLVRSITQDNCKALCPPGFFSRSGFVVIGSGGCIPCGKDRYTSEYGSTRCDTCPMGTLTERIASTSVKDCLPLPKALVGLPSPRVFALEGHDVSLICISYTIPHPKLSWIVNKNHVTGDLVKDYTNDIDVKTKRISQYVIQNATIEDSGIYTCQAQYHDGDRSFFEIDVKIGKLPGSF